jgi:hypothetical protein
MKYMLFLVILCCGCARTEQVRALTQADQAIDGIKIEVKQPQPDIPKVIKLCDSAKLSIKPSLDTEVKVETSVQDAVQNTDHFTHAAAIQAGKAQAEADHPVMSILESSGLDSLLIAGLGGLSPGLALILQRLYGVYKLKKKADEDQVAYSEDITQAKTDEDIKAVQDKHYARQMQNGTHKTLYERRKT